MYFYFGKDVLLSDSKIYRPETRVYCEVQKQAVEEDDARFSCVGSFVGKLPLLATSAQDIYEHLGQWGPLRPEGYAKKISKVPLDDVLPFPGQYYYRLLYHMPLLHWSSSQGAYEFAKMLEVEGKVPFDMPLPSGEFLLCGWGADYRTIEYQEQYTRRLIRKIYSQPGPKPTPLFFGADVTDPYVYVGIPDGTVFGRCMANVKNDRLFAAVISCLSLRKSVAPHKRTEDISLFRAMPGWERFLDDLTIGGSAHEDTVFRRNA